MDELQKSLRNQYSNDNEAYKAALKEKGITPVNSTGKVRGIQQAYYDGTIDKGTRDYMMADAIAKFARNTGRDIGNIGAQFTGGTVNNNFETSNWDKRNEELFKQQTSAEAASILNSDKGREATGQNLANEKSEHALAGSRVFETNKNEALAKAKEAFDKGDKKAEEAWKGIANEFALIESAATSDVGTEEHIANIVSSLGKAVAAGAITPEDAKAFKGELLAGFGSGIGALGAGIRDAIKSGVDKINPLDREKTGDADLDSETESDRKHPIQSALGMNATSDIGNTLNNFNNASPEDKATIVNNLYNIDGGMMDRYKLMTLVANDLIDPNADYNGVSGAEVIDKVGGFFDNPRLVEKFTEFTGKDGSKSKTLAQWKQQTATEAANSLGINLNKLSEEDKQKLIDLADDNWRLHKDAWARRVLDYLGIQY